MNFNKSPYAEQLAGEYVLGTLRGPARARFERALQHDQELQVAVRFWEIKLAELNAGIEPVAPPRGLLEAIERRLGWGAEEKPGRVRLPWLPAMAFAIVAGFSILLWAPWAPKITPDFAVTLATADGQQRWQFAVDKRHNWIDVRVISTPAEADARDLELWLLADGAAPRSLGLISEVVGDRHRIKASFDLAAGQGLAVSLEPNGGSPSGLPTGPVIAAENFPDA